MRAKRFSGGLGWLASQAAAFLGVLAAGPALAADWEGRAPDAAWRKAAAESIERHRKGTLTIQVVDTGGYPVGLASVEVRLLRHEFDFGTVVDAAVLPAAGDAGRRDREILQGWFGRVGLGRPLEWAGWETDREGALALLRSPELAGRPLRAAGLAWSGTGEAGQVPGDVAALAANPAALDARVRGHLTNVLAQIRGRVGEIELGTLPAGESPGVETVAGWYSVVQALDGASVLGASAGGDLVHGDMAVAEARRRVADALRAAGAPVEVLSVGAQFGNRFVAPMRLAGILDAVSGVHSGTGAYAVRLTGLGISGDDARAQADFLRDVMTVAFAHPSVRGVELGGFRAGNGSARGVALLDAQGGVTPAGEVWTNLVHGVWGTQATVRTAPNGRASLRALRGELEVRVKGAAGGDVVSRVRLGVDGLATVVVPASAPRLEVKPGELYEFTWPASANGFRLEESEAASGAEWVAVEGFSIRAGAVWRVQLAAPDTTRYYRLRRE